MYQTCLHCTANLGSNNVLETLPIGRQIAFDAAQGRLWVVCGKCAKWNLVPFDDRLETIDACEKLFRDTKTRYSTEHIGLAKLSEGLSLVRIGSPDGQEFASWRYGRAFQRRRLKTRWITGAIIAPPAVVMGMTRLMADGGLHGFGLLGLAYGVYQGSQIGIKVATKQRLRLKVRGADGRPVTLLQRELQCAEIKTSESGVTLKVSHNTIRADRYVELSGADADQLTCRILGKLNAIHGDPEELRAAVTAASHWSSLDESTSIIELIGRREVAPNRGAGAVRLTDINPERRLAFEMWGNEASERAFLSGQLQLLARQWREAEELAKLADGLALPEDSEAKLSQLKSRQG